MKTVNEIGDANYITHSGSFHTDELFCTVIFDKLFEDVRLFRTRKLDGVSKDAVLFDIGNGELDHHGVETRKRSNGIPYAAFGLVWERYGKEFAKKMGYENIDVLCERFDNEVISYMDAIDNGYSKVSKGPLNICEIIDHMNPKESTKEDEDKAYIEALSICDRVLVSELEYFNRKIKGEKLVNGAIESSQDGIMYLESRLPWEETLITSLNPKSKDILYVIRPGKTNADGYSINAVPVEVGSFIDRLPFPEEWRGKRDNEIQSISGIDTLKFCHKTGFLCVSDTLDDAYKTAYESIRIQNNNMTL